MLFAIAISLLYVEIKDSVLKRVFSEIVKKFWSKWELRSMVMLSLILQFLLVYFGRKRKKYTGNWVPLIAVIAWLIYFSADWMATLVLSTLLRGSSELKEGLIVFWTPFLLWHLGSPYNITAYSLEDNELWLRHFLGMFFQIGEAIYIYVRFRSNTTLNAMAIPLFIGGVLKFLERIWALRCANPKQLMKYFYSSPKTENPSTSDSADRSEMREMIRTGLFDPSEKRGFIGDPRITSEVRFLREVDSAFEVFKPLFTDLPFQISKAFHDEMVYLNPSTRTAAEAFNFVKIELEFLYDLLYTKNPLQHRHHIVSLALRCICFFSLLSVLIAFSVLYRKIEDSTVDVVVTYTLLLGAVWLESYSFYMHIRSKWTILRYAVRGHKRLKLYYRLVQNRLHLIKSQEGIQKMAQHDFLEYCVKAKASQFAQILKFIDPGDLLQKFWYTKWKEVDIELKKFIYNHLNEKRSKFEKGRFKLECLEKILAERGDNVLQEKGFDPDEKDEYWKLKTTDLPRQIFVWHIATSLVYYNDLSKHRRSTLFNPVCKISKSLSDYMMYLVLVRPTMLPKGFSDIVNKETYQQTQRISPKKKMKVSMEEFNEALLSFGFNKFSENGALWDGIKFAKQLQSLVREERWDHEEKWKMISEVWMEMMVYGASRCTWEEHAQQLRHGGELLTHVALIMAHLGLTTQVQRLEKSADHPIASAFPTPF
ncbi:hypothetical protein E1A91_D02G270200v1 [Gossypium mustelinum]|uniref:DUF4220 domain-containing protein n=1 Tax=Gossypium mustelinum TaxID=34275 RepID=A0A5D2W198_GOSMU|nr:hypothetical protein E1A91_D02G270200v1 [Gossypium mustelinum]